MLPPDETPGSETPAANAPEEKGPMTFGRIIDESKNPPPEEDADEGDDDSEDEGDSDDDTEGDSESEDSDSDEDSGDEESDDSGEEDTDEGSESDEDTDTEEDETEDEDADSEKEKGKGKKTLTLKQNGKDIEVSENAKLTFVDKDGDTVTMSLKEAGNNILTSQKLDQKFTQLDREKKAVERDRREALRIQTEHEDLQSELEDLREIASRGDLFEMASATLNMFSKGDKDIASQLLEQTVDFTTYVGDLNKEQLKIAIGNSLLKLKNAKLEKQNTRNEAKRKADDNRTWVQNFAKEQDIGWDEFTERYDALKRLDAHKAKSGQEVNIKENMSFQDIAKEVVKFAKATRHFNRTVNLIKKVDSAAAKDTALIEEICVLTNSKLKEKDVIEIIRGVLGKTGKATKKVSKPKDSSKEVSKTPGKSEKKPAKKEAPPKKATEGKETKKKDEDEGPLTFDKLKSKYS